MPEFNYRDFKNKPVPDENDIIQSWKGDLSQPRVSIVCITFNQKNYIEDALRGFLMQKTDFPFEVIIHDDASTDGTTDIIKHYAIQYPRIIKPIIQVENQYSKGNKPLSITAQYTRGQYVALCEGDDFWLDRQKLSTQFRILEENTNAVLCFHDNFVIEDGEVIQNFRIPKPSARDYTAAELQKSNAFIPLNSMFFRNVIQQWPAEFAMAKNGDTFLYSLLGNYGNAVFTNDIALNAYRVQPGGIWSASSHATRAAMAMTTFFWLSEYYKDRNANLSRHFIIKVIKTLIAYRALQSSYLAISFLLPTSLQLLARSAKIQLAELRHRYFSKSKM